MEKKSPRKNDNSAKPSRSRQQSSSVVSEDKSHQTDLIRLNALLQQFGVASRRKADKLIEDGLVQVNGKVITQLGIKVQPNSHVTVDGKKLNSSKKPQIQTFLFHKPYRFLTSRSETVDHFKPSIFTLPALQSLPSNVQPVGRLDFRSEGLLILTNDGELSFALTHPSHAVEKTYAVLVASFITPDEIEKLKKGVMLEDGLAKAMHVRAGKTERIGQTKGQWVELVVTEGRNRLVRRMMEHLSLRVIRLARVSIGNVRLPFQLEPGELREINETEKAYFDTVKKQVLTSTSKIKQPSRKPRTLKKSLNDEAYAKEAAFRDMKTRQMSKDRIDKLTQDKKPTSRRPKQESYHAPTLSENKKGHEKYNDKSLEKPRRFVKKDASQNHRIEDDKKPSAFKRSQSESNPRRSYNPESRNRDDKFNDKPSSDRPRRFVKREDAHFKRSEDDKKPSTYKRNSSESNQRRSYNPESRNRDDKYNDKPTSEKPRRFVKRDDSQNKRSEDGKRTSSHKRDSSESNQRRNHSQENRNREDKYSDKPSSEKPRRFVKRDDSQNKRSDSPSRTSTRKKESTESKKPRSSNFKK